MMTIWRAATYNIRHGLGDDGRVDLARTAAEIAALEADVVGLQEVDAAFGPRSGHEDQAARLGELLGMQVAVGAAIDREPARPGEARRRYGVALLTRHELVAREMHLLPEHPGCLPAREPRGVLLARVRRPGDTGAAGEADGLARAGGADATSRVATGAELTVLVTHLDSLHRQHRTAEVQGIVRLADGLPDAAPSVLMGDMNADPAAPELAALTATGWREAAQEVERTGGAARRPWPRRRP